MRDFFVPLALVAVAVGGIWLYIDKVAFPEAARQSARAPSIVEAAPPVPPKPGAKSVRTPRKATPDVSIPEELPAQVSAPATLVASRVSPAPPKRAPLRLDDTNQVQVGMPVNRVVELLGAPDLTAVTSQRGNLLETYVYKGRSGEVLAFINISEGRVVGKH